MTYTQKKEKLDSEPYSCRSNSCNITPIPVLDSQYYIKQVTEHVETIHTHTRQPPFHAHYTLRNENSEFDKNKTQEK